MPNAARLGDLSTGHDCFPPRPNNQASHNVFVNERGAHRQGDGYVPHCCGKTCHGGVLAHGSSSVFVNARQAGRIRDKISCSERVMTGSHNVFIGG